ncbi:MAG: LrgB family protein [Lachnospiraceae bacterium]
MSNFVFESAMFGMVLTISSYLLGVYLKNKFKLAILNPLLLSVIISIIVLLVFHINYDDYYESAKYVSYLLTPATVCLAIPLYQKIALLKKYATAIIAGIIAGVISSLGSILGFAVLFQLTHEEYVTLLPKSITTAIGIGVSEEHGGIVTITVAVIIITGLLGNMLAESICKMFKITNPVAKGIAIGTSSHAVGTAKAMEMGEVEGAMSSLAIVVAGICTVIGAAVFVHFW